MLFFVYWDDTVKWKGLRRKRSWPVSRYYAGGTQKNHNKSHSTSVPGRDSNLGLPGYKAEFL